MKTNPVSLLLVLITALLVLAGCAGVDASHQKSLLTASGFRSVIPQTDKQKELYAAAESYKVLHFTSTGKDLYAYKDEADGVAYIGGPAEYQRYQKLALEQHIAETNYQAAQMDSATAMSWSGAYGPRYGGMGQFNSRR